MNLLTVDGIKVHFGGVRALDGVSLVVRQGGIHALIGPNGAGKTSFVNAITGIYRPSAGRVHLGDADITGLPAHRLATRGVTRTFQNLQVFWTMTVMENVMSGFHLSNGGGFFGGLLRGPGLLRREARLADEAVALLDMVGMKHRAAEKASALPYGELKRLEIARALACRPKLLFLDEPVAGCTQMEKHHLGEVIRNVADQSGTTILLIEHDMRLVMGISDRITVLTRGTVLAEGTPTEVKSNPAVVEAYLGRATKTDKVKRHAVAS